MSGGVRELMKANPEASDNQIEELAMAIQGNDAIAVDRISKEIAQTAAEAKAKAEREKERSQPPSLVIAAAKVNKQQVPCPRGQAVIAG